MTDLTLVSFQPVSRVGVTRHPRDLVTIAEDEALDRPGQRPPHRIPRHRLLLAQQPHERVPITVVTQPNVDAHAQNTALTPRQLRRFLPHRRRAGEDEGPRALR